MGIKIVKTKAEIRDEMRRRRRMVTDGGREEASASVCASILAREDVRGQIAARRPFAVYLASMDELDLTPLIEALWAAGVTVAVPCWNAGEKRYRLGAYDNVTTLVEGLHRIPEPAEVNAVDEADVGVWIVPGLAFTRDGARLGYGGGWYDRLLGDSAPDSLALGVAYPFQLLDEVPRERHDRILDAVVVAS